MIHTPASPRPWHPFAKDAVLALWLTSAGNLPLWLAVWHLPQAQARPGLLPGLALLLFATSMALFALFMWAPWRRALGLVLLACAGLASHFMAAYGIVIDPGMLANLFHTDALEVRGLLDGPLLLALALGVALPAWWWWRVPVQRLATGRLLLQRAVVLVLSLLLVAGLVFAQFQDLATLSRNHKPLRYMVNPYNTVYALLRQGASESARAAQPLRPLGEDVQVLAATDDPDAAPVIVLVVGETARAANFGVGGYARDTTPRLSALAASGELLYFPQVRSCGTSTQVSVPCMFSRLGRAGLNAPPEENALDLLQRAGQAVLWIDNQAGCKGVCDRVPHQRAAELAGAAACPGEGCWDSALPALAMRALPQLDAQRRTHGSVIVLHQMGNHGPAYFERSPAARKVFLPECETNTLSACERQEIVNAYDNAIRETDAMLGELVDRLTALHRPAALLYVSDHGESLGENGLYLHGMPWSLAPDEQKHVPMALWLSPSMQARLRLDRNCLHGLTALPWSHDNLFHTLAGLAQVQSHAVDRARDLLAGCRESGPARVTPRLGQGPIDAPVNAPVSGQVRGSASPLLAAPPPGALPPDPSRPSHSS